MAQEGVDKMEGLVDDKSKIEVDEFDAMFDTASGEDQHPDLNNADNPDNVKAGDEELPPDNGNPSPSDNNPPPVDDNNEPPPTITPTKEDDATYEQRWKTLQGVYKHDKETLQQEIDRLKAENEEIKKAKETPPPAPDPVIDKSKDDEAFLKSFLDSLTDEQKESLKKYDEEFDVISAMEGLKRDSAMKKLRKDMLDEIDRRNQEVLAQIKPATELVEQAKVDREKSIEEAHFEAIRSAHPDFETYRDDGSILKWIESKPVYLQRGMIEVYKEGTSEEIVSLLSAFKKDNNISPSPAPDNVINLDRKRQDRKSALNVPDTRQSSINQGVARKDNYEDAWDEAQNR